MNICYKLFLNIRIISTGYVAYVYEFYFIFHLFSAGFNIFNDNQNK